MPNLPWNRRARSLSHYALFASIFHRWGHVSSPSWRRTCWWLGPVKGESDKNCMGPLDQRKIYVNILCTDWRRARWTYSIYLQVCWHTTPTLTHCHNHPLMPTWSETRIDSVIRFWTKTIICTNTAKVKTDEFLHNNEVSDNETDTPYPFYRSSACLLPYSRLKVLRP